MSLTNCAEAIITKHISFILSDYLSFPTLQVTVDCGRLWFEFLFLLL